MNEQSDAILTPNSDDDDFLKRVLDRRLWGYPKLVDAAFRVKDRIRNIEKEREKRRAENEKHRSNAEAAAFS